MATIVVSVGPLKFARPVSYHTSPHIPLALPPRRSMPLCGHCVDLMQLGRIHPSSPLTQSIHPSILYPNDHVASPLVYNVRANRVGVSASRTPHLSHRSPARLLPITVFLPYVDAVVGSDGRHVEVRNYLQCIGILLLPLSAVTSSICIVNTASHHILPSYHHLVSREWLRAQR
jgi:hypothetical protein